MTKQKKTKPAEILVTTYKITDPLEVTSEVLVVSAEVSAKEISRLDSGSVLYAYIPGALFNYNALEGIHLPACLVVVGNDGGKYVKAFAAPFEDDDGWQKPQLSGSGDVPSNTYGWATLYPNNKGVYEGVYHKD